MTLKDRSAWEHTHSFASIIQLSVMMLRSSGDDVVQMSEAELPETRDAPSKPNDEQGKAPQQTRWTESKANSRLVVSRAH